MPSVEEILKASGLTDEQVKALDAKVVAGFTTIISTAAQEREAAELAKRAQSQQYDEQIAPALDSWANEKAALDAKVAFYQKALEGAKAGGFQIPEIPVVPGSPVKDPTTGKFVASGTPTNPAAPTIDPRYMTRKDGFDAISAAQWTIAEYMRLHNGAPPPDDMAALADESVAARMPYRQYVEKKYDFGAKREKIKTDAQKAHDDAIRKEETERVTKELTEKFGSNPNVRQAEVSSFSEVRKAVKDGTRPDPLTMTPQERAQATRNAIRKEVAERETVQ